MELTSDQPLDIVRRRASKHMTVQHIESHLVQLIRYWIEAPFLVFYDFFMDWHKALMDSAYPETPIHLILNSY